MTKLEDRSMYTWKPRSKSENTEGNSIETWKWKQPIDENSKAKVFLKWV